MSLTIDLPPDLEAELAAEAARLRLHTFDARHYRVVPGLTVARPYKR